MLHCLCFWPLLLSAQTRIENTSLKHKDSALLYVGVPNIIKISGIENINNIELKSTRGELSPAENGKYKLFVNSVNYPDTLSIYQNGEFVTSKIFNVKLLSEPIIKLGTIPSNYATIDEIKRNNKLQVHLHNWEYKAEFKVVNFRLTIQNHFGKIVSSDEINFGNAISADQLNVVKKLEQSSKLIFENIKVVGSDKIERQFPTCIITVK